MENSIHGCTCIIGYAQCMMYLMMQIKNETKYSLGDGAEGKSYSLKPTGCSDIL